MTKMILCVVFIFLISVPEGCLQSISTDVSSTQSTIKPTSNNPSSPTSGSTTHTLTTTTSTDVSSTQSTFKPTSNNPSSPTSGSTTHTLTTTTSTDVSSTQSTFKPTSNNPSSPTSGSTTHTLTTTTSTADSSATRSATDHSTAQSTDDRSITDTTGSEYTSGSQTPLDFKSTTAQQTTQMDVTKRNQTTSQFTWQSQKSTVLKPPESTNETAFPTGLNSSTSSTALENKGGHDVAGNPGLIAVLCIFFITVAVLIVIVIVKVVRARSPQFERLDDVPMGKISEDAPFARYPPK